MRQEIPVSTILPAIPASQLAELLGWNPRTLQNQLPSLGLPYCKIGRSVVFLADDVHAFLRRHRVANDPVPVVEPQPVRRGRGRPKGAITRRHSGGEG